MSAVPSYPHDIFTDEVLRDPHEHYRALRELGPVVWLDAHQLYVLPRYAEVRATLADAETFCSGEGVGLNDVINEAGRGTTLMSDGEPHQHLRSVIGPGLTPRALRSMQSTVERLASDRVAELVARGRVDAVADLARALPLSFVPDLVGWPIDGREQLLEWASATFDLFGPLNDRALRAVPQVQAMVEFAIRAATRGDFLPGSIGAAVIEAVGRGTLEPEQVPPLLLDYIGPSLDTTISAIGSAIWLLATYPDQWNLLKRNPSLIPNAFNEVVRLESPIRAFSRVTTSTTRVGDHDIPAGSRLIVLYASANRDDQHFDRADEFDITRANAAQHVGFGYGSHGCAGQGLARQEGQAVLQALIDQVDTIELGDPVRGLNNVICSWASLPVTLHPLRQPASARP